MPKAITIASLIQGVLYRTILSLSLLAMTLTLICQSYQEGYCTKMSQSVTAIRIGAGGHADVYNVGKGIVKKGIRTKSECDNARTEYSIQATVRNDIMKISRRTPRSHLEELAKKYVTVPRPISFCESACEIKGALYDCSLLMTQVKGFPALTIFEAVPDVNLNVSSAFLSDAAHWDVLIQLSMNSEFPEGLYGARSGPVSATNPTRGYMVREGSRLLQQLREGVPGLPKLELSDSEISALIGYLYANMFYHANIIPFDVEFVLGMKESKTGSLSYVIAILDFGLALDIRNPETWTKDRKYEQLLTAGLSRANIDRLRAMVMQDITYDIYCDLSEEYADEPFSGLAGWLSVEEEFSDIYMSFLNQ